MNEYVSCRYCSSLAVAQVTGPTAAYPCPLCREHRDLVQLDDDEKLEVL